MHHAQKKSSLNSPAASLYVYTPYAIRSAPYETVDNSQAQVIVLFIPCSSIMMFAHRFVIYFRLPLLRASCRQSLSWCEMML